MQRSGPAGNSSSAFLMITPLANWRAAEQSITEGISIRRLTPREREALELSKALLEHHDIDSSARNGYWLCYDFENSYPADNVRFRRRQEAAFKLMLHAMYSVQILMPIGAANLLLLYRRTADGLTLDSTQHRPAFIGTVWAGLCDVPASFGEEISLILERVHDAFQRPTLRLQIPVWLLEQGLSAPDRHIRILLWATGLDGVTRSGGTAAFAERLCGLLGPDTGIFPPWGTNRKPGYSVADVAGDLYLLRNEMAHGLPFHEKFRKTRGFLAADGLPVSEEFANYRYDHVLEECAGFLLCKALREVFLRNRLYEVQSMSSSEYA
jgi:hypothetical protein